MNYKKLFLVISSIYVAAICHGGKISPEKNAEKIELFNSEHHNVKNIYHRCAPWVKGDLTPVLKDVENKDGKWIKFSFSGSKGLSQANFITDPKKLTDLLPENTQYRGLKVGIYYPENDFLKISVSLAFSDKTILVKSIALKQGYHEYIVASGFRRAKFPPKWNLLKTVGIVVRSSKAIKTSFLIKKIIMLTKKVKAQKKNLKITDKKKVTEIFKSDSPLLKNGEISTTAWQNTKSIRDFICNKKASNLLLAKITYDDKYLYVGTQARFNSTPVSNTKPGSTLEKLWADELLEYFFSGENDNQKKIQFVTNLNGATWDAIVEFDVVAAAVIRKTNNWSLEHKKELRFKNNIWETNALFPLQKIKVDLKKERFIGFQLAQNYAKSSSVIWSPSKKFPDAKKFGVLVFNKKTFGKGEIEIKKLESSGVPNASNVDLQISLSSKNFPPGNYKYSIKIVHSDATCVKDSGSIKLISKLQNQKLKICNLKNINGIYTIYFSIFNKNNDIKLTAVNFENSKDFLNLFGKKIFSVAPKKIKWGKENFPLAKYNKLYIGNKPSARTLKTAKIFVDKIYAYSGIKYNIVKATGNDSINFKITPFKSEGYKLSITPKSTNITGADEAGLYYGMITFMQILRMPMKIKDSAPMQCVEIIDWPDKQMRILSLLHPWNFPQGAIKENRGINYLIKWLDRYVAGNKLNTAVIDLSSLVKYKRHPEFNKKQAIYSLEDIKKLAQYCRDNFIEFIPRWQTGGHSNWWLTIIYPELREKGSKAQADVTHPDHNKIVFDCIKDVLEASGAKYINAGMDEWWHGWKKGETPDKLLCGKPRAEALRDWVIQLNNFCQKNNVKMIMEGDMLYPGHNGTRFDCYKEIDKIPKDIIITNWGMIDGATQYFHDKGFKTMSIVTGEYYPGNKTKLLIGMGINCYGFTSFNINRLNYPTILTRYADYVWNCYSDKKGKSRDCISSGALLAAMESLASKPNPHASEKIDCLDLQNFFQNSFNIELKKNYPKAFASVKEVFKSLPEGKKIIGNIPMQLGTKEKNCIILGKNRGKIIPINRKCSSLIFLQTAIGDMKEVKKWHWRKWYYGFPLGDYQIVYNDNSKVKIPLRLCDNIYFANCPSLNAVPIGCRYIMPLKNINGNYNFLYQYEWVNPYPEKKIKKIKYIHDGVYNLEIALLALSTRQLKN